MSDPRIHLVRIGTNRVVYKQDQVVNRDGEQWTVNWISPPRHEGSTGKVTFNLGNDETMEYYAGVGGLEFITPEELEKRGNNENQATLAEWRAMYVCDGRMFIPNSGICGSCRIDLVKYYNETGRGSSTGCPSCNKSYVD